MTSLNRLLPGLAAPLLVAAGLVLLRSAPFVFVAYHLLLCLLVPLLQARRSGLGFAAHARALGLNRRGLQAGLLLGLGSALVPPLAFAFAPSLFPDVERLRAALAGWGLPPAAPALFLFFMAVFNGPSEELFWRGWLLRGPVPGPPARVALALLFTSYHVLTIGRLAPTPAAAALLVAGTLLGALAWTWMRARWQSVWPALCSHTGITCGYLYVCARLLAET
ncbi:MAG: CPBP family intramembrane metalloprotease [bacterium]|nr:CPBP family intramembrane metalloprotease [bacterium]